MKNKRLWLFIATHRAAALAYLIATILYSIYQFYSPLNQFVGFGLMMILHASMWIFAAVPWIVAGMLCATIAIVFWLAAIRSSILAALVGFAINYLVVSLLTTILEASIFIEITIGLIVAYTIFSGVSWLISRISVRRTPSIVIGTIFLGLTLYFTPILTHPIEARRATAKADASFKSAVNGLSFSPYYPTYSSSIYPASAAKLNGYENIAYSNETVTFTLGDAEVKQGGYLNGQDKVMNFVDNCTIYRLWF